jgi:hypothetical protein
MRQRGPVGQSGLDRVETRPLKASDHVGVVRHVPMVAVAQPSTEVDSAENAASIAVNSIDLGVAISQALSRAGLNNKQACAWMEIDPGLWSRQLQGDGHVSFQRLLKLPIIFWTEFIPLLGEPIGLSVSAEDPADRAMLQAAVAVEQLVRSAVAMRRSRRGAA